MGVLLRVGLQRLVQGQGREGVVAHRGQRQLGIARDGDHVARGFLLEADDPSVDVGLDDAELRGLADRHRQAGDGGQRVLGQVEVHHLAHVHLVDVVGAEDHDDVGAEVLDQVEVLVDGVGGAAVPAFAHAHLRRHDGHEVGVRAAGAPHVLDVLDQRLGLVLREHVHGADARVVHVGQHEVDDAVAAAEGNGGLGAVAGQGEEPFPFAASHDEGE